ncbi:MAG: hypothetical protein HRU80_09980 [Ignavibacteriales bacterium]|nr:hypothetical protein [Ignavibacteriaceae bacterium]QOJ29196.1 MAG: hypothetical protein HRU80_09980 [Ignavibacteriales bacterium]
MKSEPTNKSLHSRKKFFGLLSGGVIGTLLLQNVFTGRAISSVSRVENNTKIIVKPEPLAVQRKSSGKNDVRA